MHTILIYLHIIHLLKSSTCFEHYHAHLQEVYVVIVYMQPLVLSLFAGDCPVQRLSSFEQNVFSLHDWLTVHRGITLVNFQLDAQNSYLFTYNTFIKIFYVFRALPCSSSGGLRRNCIYAVSGIVTLCR